LKKNRNTMQHDKVRGLVQQGHKRVLIDLADVSYVDSDGLGELVQASSTGRIWAAPSNYSVPPTGFAS
jgi:anti-anti-sigma regulatory factor